MLMASAIRAIKKATGSRCQICRHAIRKSNIAEDRIVSLRLVASGINFTARNFAFSVRGSSLLDFVDTLAL